MGHIQSGQHTAWQSADMLRYDALLMKTEVPAARRPPVRLGQGA